MARLLLMRWLGPCTPNPFLSPMKIGGATPWGTVRFGGKARVGETPCVQVVGLADPWLAHEKRRGRERDLWWPRVAGRTTRKITPKFTATAASTSPTGPGASRSESVRGSEGWTMLTDSFTSAGVHLRAVAAPSTDNTNRQERST
jgi:hypothetical protein